MTEYLHLQELVLDFAEHFKHTRRSKISIKDKERFLNKPFCNAIILWYLEEFLLLLFWVINCD